MEISNLVYYGFGGCVIILILAVVSNLSVNVLIKQFTERALHGFQLRLAQETSKALAAFKAGVCEQMSIQQGKSDSLAKLYAALIDLLRDGKGFIASIDKGDPFLTEKSLITFEDASESFCELIRKQSLHFGDEFKGSMEGFAAEQEAIIRLFEAKWNSNGRESQDRKIDNDLMRQAWAAFEDRASVTMGSMRDEFRSRMQAPESMMKKWLNDVPPKHTPPPN